MDETLNQYNEGILNAIKILDDEVQALRAKRDSTIHERAKVMYSDQMLAHILSIQHLRESITNEKEEQ
jgi:hypothetical protein